MSSRKQSVLISGLLDVHPTKAEAHTNRDINFTNIFFLSYNTKITKKHPHSAKVNDI